MLGTSIASWSAMKLAIPVWQGRISPVFDVAGQLLLVELTDGQEVAREGRLVEGSEADERAKKLAELGVETLICAGISQSLETDLTDRGVRVIARICGNVEEVLAAFVAGRLREACFAMPGCCGQRRRRHRGGCGRRGPSGK
jgi:predicted Fe-Mo cluster-binding NifX family protein